MLMLALVVLGHKRLHAMAGTWPERKLNSRTHRLQRLHPSRCRFRLSFGSALRKRESC